MGGYNYRLNTQAYEPNSFFEYLPKGSYNVCIKDANDCKLDSMIDIRERDYPKIQYHSTTDSIRCHGSKDGKLTIHASTAIRPYTYAIKGQTYSSDSVIKNLDSGTHLFRVRDAKGCFKEFAIHFANPSPLRLSLMDKSGLKCRGDSNAYIQVRVQGGRNYLNDYQLQWSHGQSGILQTNLKKGVYSVTATDQNLCKDSMKVAIDYLYDSLYLLHALTNPVRCMSDSQAIITVYGIGGLAPYQYSFHELPFSNQGIFPNLGYGVYPVIVRDSAGCIANVTVINTFIDTPMKAKIWFDSFLCPYSTNTSLRLTPINGKPPYHFSINNSSYQPLSSTISIPTNTKIEYRIKDSINCIHRDSLLVPTPKRPDFKLRIAVNKCHFDSIGQINIDSINAKFLPILFSLDKFNYSPNRQFEKLKTGNHILYSKDSLNCIYQDSFHIKTQSQFNFTITTEPAICKYDYNGKIKLNYPYLVFAPEVSIDGAAYSKARTFENLARKKYQLRFLYDYDCYLDSFTTIFSLDSLTNSYLVDSIRCFGEDNGQITINSQNGKPPYTYYLNNDFKGNSNSFSNLEADKDYWIKTVSSYQCVDSALIRFHNPPKLEIYEVITHNVTCFNFKNGSINFKTRGGRGAHSLFINNHYQPSYTISNLAPDRYQILVRDQSQCTATWKAWINEPEKLKLRLDSMHENKCYGQNIGMLSLIASGGLEPYSIRWNTGSEQFQINSLEHGKLYRAVIEDKNNCQDSFQYQFQSLSPIAINLSIRDATCPYTEDGKLKAEITGGTPINTLGHYKLQFMNSNLMSNKIQRALSKGIYLLQIEDKNQCKKDTIVQIDCAQEPNTELDSIYEIMDLGGSVKIEPRFVSHEIGTFSWSPSLGLSCTDCSSPTASPFVTTQYAWSYQYHNGQCFKTKYTQVRLPSIKHDIYIPNVFSPLSNLQENKTFRVFGNKIKRAHLVVFNRWGEKVYDSIDFLSGWDGKYKDLDQPTGVHVYYAEIEFLDGYKIKRKGEFTLLR